MRATSSISFIDKLLLQCHQFIYFFILKYFVTSVKSKLSFCQYEMHVSYIVHFHSEKIPPDVPYLINCRYCDIEHENSHT